MKPEVLRRICYGVGLGGVLLALAAPFAVSIGLPVSDRVRIWDSTTTATVGTGTNKHLYIRGTDGTINQAYVTGGFAKVAMSDAAGTSTLFVTPSTDAFSPAAAVGTFGTPYAFNGTTWDRARSVGGAVDTTGTGIPAAGLIGLYDSTPGPYTDGRYGPVQMSQAGFLLTAPGSGQTWPVSVAGTVTVDSELPAAAAMADAQSNPTVPHVGANAKWWNGSTWDRAPGDVTNGAYVNIKASIAVPVTDNSGSLTVDAPIATPVQVSESYDSASSRTQNTTLSTTAAAAPATALAARRLVRVYNTDASINVYLCLNNASCANSAGANFGILLPPGGQRDYPIGPTNVLYAVAASGTPVVITEELK